MKKLHYILGIVLVTLVTSCSTSRNYAQSPYYDNNNYYQGEVSYQQFYDDLNPYGSWISYPGYGYVWSPYEAGFTPYSSNGQWVYTTYGWTWASNYRWGWAPFHYGRWFLDARFGWLWMPGYEWAPAWVAWRGGGGYYGWAPLGPGMSFNISIGSIPGNYWNFVPGRYIGHRNVYNYRVNNYTTIINNTTVINNNYYNNNRTVNYNAGPPVREVERVTNQRIAPVRVVNSSTPGSSEIKNNQMAVYRPQVNQNAGNSRPTRVVTEPIKKEGATARPVRQQSNTNNGSSFQNNGIDQARPVGRNTQNNAGTDVNARPSRTPATVNSPTQRSVEKVESVAPGRPTTSAGSSNTGSQVTRESNKPVQVAPPRQEITTGNEPVRQVRPQVQNTIQPKSTKPVQTQSNPVVRPQSTPPVQTQSNQRVQSQSTQKVQPQRSSQPVTRSVQPAPSTPAKAQSGQRVQSKTQSGSSRQAQVRESSSTRSSGPVRKQ